MSRGQLQKDGCRRQAVRPESRPADKAPSENRHSCLSPSLRPARAFPHGQEEPYYLTKPPIITTYFSVFPPASCSSLKPFFQRPGSSVQDVLPGTSLRHISQYYSKCGRPHIHCKHHPASFPYRDRRPRSIIYNDKRVLPIRPSPEKKEPLKKRCVRIRKTWEQGDLCSCI